MKLVYLVRGDDGIKIVHKKPAGVTISEKHTMWFLRGFSFPMGENGPQFHYNGMEVLGVFDLDKPRHFVNLTKMFESHLRHYLEKVALKAICAITPVEIPNAPPPKGPGGVSRTLIAEALIKVFRRDDKPASW